MPTMVRKDGRVTGRLDKKVLDCPDPDKRHPLCLAFG